MKIFSNKKIKFLLKLGVSLVFVAWLILKINWLEVLDHVSKVSYAQLGLYVIILLLGMVLSSYKWMVLAEFKGFQFSLKEYFQLYLTGTFINNFFPSFIGGDTYKAYQLGKKEKKYIASTSTVVMDRVTGLLGAMLLSIVFACFNWKFVLAHPVLLLIVSVSFVVLIGVLTIGFLAKFSFWKNISGLVPKKILEVIKDFAQYRGSQALNGAFLLAIIYGLVGLALLNYVLFSALGIHVGVLDYLTVIFLVSIVSSVPISINNIGIKEWAYVTFFGFFGVPATAVIAVALLSRILQMLVSFAALPYYLKNHQK